MSEQDRLIRAAEERHADARHLFEGERYSGAVSSSYYAVFNAAKALLIGGGFATEDPSRCFFGAGKAFQG